MATVAKTFVDPNAQRQPRTPGSRIAHTIDRWIYVFMAVWFIVIAIAGFIPDDLSRQAAAQAGKAAPFSPLMPLHATLMSAWLLLLLVQTSLAATGRMAQHQWLGRAAFVLVPAMVVVLVIDVPFAYRFAWNFLPSAPPAARPGVLRHLYHDGHLLLEQARDGLLFPVYIAIALPARRTDPELHKRMMILATAAPLLAAIARITWLPRGFPFAGETYLIAALLPMFLWDVVRHKRILRAYPIWLAIYAPTSLAIWWWADSPALNSAIPLIMGI